MAKLMVLVSIVVLSLFAVIVGVMLYVHETPDQALIRKYLRENTPTGKWEEIEWKIDTTSTTLKLRTENKFRGKSIHTVSIAELEGQRHFRGIGEIQYTPYHEILGWKPDPNAPRDAGEALARESSKRREQEVKDQQ
jgi:hypothetical protein